MIIEKTAHSFECTIKPRNKGFDGTKLYHKAIWKRNGCQKTNKTYHKIIHSLNPLYWGSAVNVYCAIELSFNILMKFVHNGPKSEKNQSTSFDLYGSYSHHFKLRGTLGAGL